MCEFCDLKETKVSDYTDRDTEFGISDIFQLYNEYVNVPDSPFGGNYKGHLVKNGEKFK